MSQTLTNSHIFQLNRINISAAKIKTLIKIKKKKLFQKYK